MNTTTQHATVPEPPTPPTEHHALGEILPGEWEKRVNDGTATRVTFFVPTTDPTIVTSLVQDAARSDLLQAFVDPMRKGDIPHPDANDVSTSADPLFRADAAGCNVSVTVKVDGKGIHASGTLTCHT